MAQKALNDAIAAFNDKRYDEAYTLWTENIGEVDEKSRADLHVNRGKAKQGGNALDEALACYAEALALAPAHLSALRARTTVHIRREDWVAALASAEEAAAAAPGDGAAAADVAFAHFKAGNAEAAVAAFERARSLGDTSTNTTKLYGSALSLRAAEVDQSGNAEGAVAMYDAAIAVEPTEARVYNRGLLLMRLAEVAGEKTATGKFTARALADLRHAVRLNQAHPRAHAALGTLLSSVGDFAAAVVALKSAAKYVQNDASIPYNLGFCQLQLGQIAEARAAFEAALKVNPDLEEAKQGLKVVNTKEADSSLLAGTSTLKSVAVTSTHPFLVKPNVGGGEAAMASAAPKPAAQPSVPAPPTAAPAPPAAAAGGGGGSGGDDDPASYFSSDARAEGEFEGYKGVLAPLSVLLKPPYPDGVNKGHREAYLSSAEFKAALGVDKQAFYAQPKWKRDAAKKKASLF
jgi:tetratricopeptide (TPR) repeat protein